MIRNPCIKLEKPAKIKRVSQERSFHNVICSNAVVDVQLEISHEYISLNINLNKYYNSLLIPYF